LKRAAPLLLVLAAACGPTTHASTLPTDLPPPEYEPPRGLDLTPKKPSPTPSAAPAPPAAPPAPPAAPPKAP
jgi:hypothetical protein